jgi:phage shock protein PspC (stress-responsive transcriptional regulator)
MEKLKLSRDDKWIAGVCGGIARKFSIDSDVLRIITVILFLCPYVPVVLIYIILWIIMPSND